MKLIIYTIIIVALTLTVVILGNQYNIITFIQNNDWTSSIWFESLLILSIILLVYLIIKLISFLKKVEFITKQRKANKILNSKNDKLDGRKY